MDQSLNNNAGFNRGEYSEFISEQALSDGMKPRPDPATDAELAPLVQKLCQFFSDLKQAQPDQNELYLPAGEWKIYLESQQAIYRPLLDADIAAATELFRNFWRNALGPVVKQYATFEKLESDQQTRDHYIDLMAYDFMIWKNLLDADTAELEVPAVGNPWGYEIDNVMIAPKALRYHALARQIEDITQSIERPVIAEVGAGYGGTAHKLLEGDRDLVYINFDLPEVLTIAAYYLGRTVSHRRIKLWQPGMTISAEDFQQHDVLLMPNWMLPALPTASVDMFLNTFSLSEMTYPVVSEYLSHIERACRGFFLYNNMDRSGVVSRGHERVPCSQYPISSDSFRQLYKRYDLFQRLHSGRDGDYREVLLQRI